MKTYNKPNTKLLSLNIKKSVLEDEHEHATSIGVDPDPWQANQMQFNDAIDDFMK